MVSDSYRGKVAAAVVTWVADAHNDPAISYSHRETDIAFMHLFGGFPPVVFEAYEPIFPLSPKAKNRFPNYNLYHLMNHANIFGGVYCEQVSHLIYQIIPANLEQLG